MNHETREIDVAALRARGTRRVIGSEVYHHRVLSSTMDEARELAEQGCKEGTVVIAERQTAGRGRFDRTWVSSAGLDLLFSLVLRPTTAQLRYVNMAVTLAISETVADQTGMATTVKWPNDVKLSRRKVAGILIEAAANGESLDHAVAGVGLNVNADPTTFEAIASSATSMHKEAGRLFDRTAVLRALLDRLDVLYDAVKAGESLTGRWSATLETLGRRILIRRGDQVLEGMAEAVDEDGNLVLATADIGLVTVMAGEVTLQE